MDAFTRGNVSIGSYSIWNTAKSKNIWGWISEIEKGKFRFMVLNRNPLETYEIQFGTMDYFEWSCFDSATMNQIYPTFMREAFVFGKETFDGRKYGNLMWMWNH